MKLKNIFVILIISLFTSCEDGCFLGVIGPCDEDEQIEIEDVIGDPANATFNVLVRDINTSQSPSNTIPANSNTIEVYFKLNDIDGNPVPNKTENFFEIYEKPQSNSSFNLISVNEAFRKIDPDKADFKYFNTIVLDLSGSVIQNNLEQLKMATSSFVQNIYGQVNAENLFTSILWFDGNQNISIFQNFTADEDLLQQKIQEINDTLPSDQSTNLNGAIIQSINYTIQEVNSQSQFITGGSILFFTDGTDQANFNTTNEALSIVNNANLQGLDIYSVGLGNEIDQNILSQVGYSGSFFPEDSDQLEEEFTSVAQEIENEANSFYLLQYCTPKRNGGNILRIGISNEISIGGEASFNASGFQDNCTIE
ncbi:VWA domain-containing protein [uncultured Dokdonia sp.]|uniref:VWA domain-containing protein n=1 Tax=uncultured Dokdonia sp. TaxID=575653 RepID=UPI00260DFB7E|nr:VWA domain-containing protein [uncultured Dokdonia sp.]